MPEAIFRKDGDTVEFTAAADLDPGQLLLCGGLAGVVQGLQKVKRGELCSAAIKGQFDIVSASGTTFAVGAAVGWDESASAAIANASATDTGDFYLGKAAAAKVSGQTTVLVTLNE
jgi:predicted RecA/RadA family phage recombinase